MTDTPSSKPSRPLLMAHYMPWYQSPEESRYWGWHWTMDHFDPDKVGPDGFPQIASHYMPLTGPYDTRDKDLLEYQVLLMKISGIDGVIVDWYGASTYADYPVINQSTLRLFEQVKKAGLLFAVCYEDQTIKHRVEANRLDDARVYEEGQKDLLYLQETWFKDDAYLKHKGQPVILNFGPQYFINGADWETLFMVLDERPVLVTLDQHFVPAAVSTFPWPPMWSSQDGILSQAGVENYLDGFYKKASSYKFVVAGAFPGFHDIYQEAGVSDSYGYLDAQDDLIFELTLQKALASDPDLIQLITWNDYGEGTIIEPTEEFGYRYLEMVQDARSTMNAPDPVDSGFTYQAEDLRLPLKLFQLRKTHEDPETRTRLDEVSELLLAGETTQAAEILDGIP